MSRNEEWQGRKQIMKRHRQINGQTIASWFEDAPNWLLWCACGIALFVFIVGGIVMSARNALWIVWTLFGCVLLIASILSIAARSSSKGEPHDPELRFVWSVNKEGAVTTWRMKSVTDAARFRRGGRFVVGLYAAFSGLICVGYGVIVWNVMSNDGGLRARDLPIFIPVALIALLLLGSVLRIAWNALHDQYSFQVQYDPVKREIRSIGLQPLKGIVHASLPIGDVSRLSALQSTYKSATTVRVVAFDADGGRHLLFGGLNLDDWARISAVLLPPLRAVGAC